MSFQGEIVGALRVSLISRLFGLIHILANLPHDTLLAGIGTTFSHGLQVSLCGSQQLIGVLQLI